MEAMIENGADWMQPMLDMRDWLVETQIPENKPKIRDHRRRNGKVEYFEVNGEKRLIWGPYTLEFRKEILRKLLQAQNAVRKNGPDPNVSLISDNELEEIRKLWLHDEHDWEDSLPKIYNEETGVSRVWITDDHTAVGSLEKTLVEQTSMEFGLPCGLMQDLFDVERRHAGMSRRSRIYAAIDDIFAKDWCTAEQALAETQNQPGVDE